MLGRSRAPFQSRSPLASAFAHAIAGAALWPLFRADDTPERTWLVGAALAVIPDLDVIGFRFGVEYGDLLGHRGLTHSLIVAAVVGAAVGLLLTRGATPDARRRVMGYLMLAMASHGVLDTMTTGGLGVALFAPLVDTRYFLPWRPIAVSPLGIRPFFTMHGLAILVNEALWVGVPSLLVAAAGWRRQRPAIARSNRAPTRTNGMSIPLAIPSMDEKPVMTDLPAPLDAVDVRITRWMARHGVTLLRISLGVVFLWFGALKLVPGLSPAQDLAARTIERLSFGTVGPALSLPILAIWECVIGIGLLSGRFLRATLLLLAAQMAGTLTPLLLFPGELFTRIPYAPTLEGQYIIKNAVLISAGLVIGATVRGGGLVADPTPPRAHGG